MQQYHDIIPRIPWSRLLRWQSCIGKIPEEEQSKAFNAHLTVLHTIAPTTKSSTNNTPYCTIQCLGMNVNNSGHHMLQLDTNYLLLCPSTTNFVTLDITPTPHIPRPFIVIVHLQLLQTAHHQITVSAHSSCLKYIQIFAPCPQIQCYPLQLPLPQKRMHNKEEAHVPHYIPTKLNVGCTYLEYWISSVQHPS